MTTPSQPGPSQPGLGAPAQPPLAEAVESLDAVAAACAFLSNLLLRREAGPAVVAALDVDTAQSWPLRGNASIAAGVQTLVDALGDGAADDELLADHERLFIGPGPMLACPFESVHRSNDGLTFEAETLHVRMAYAQFGLEAPALGREPDDHIGLEIAFIGELSVAALRSLEDGDAQAARDLVAAELEFLADHLSAWGPTVADLVVEHAQTNLYRALGLLLAGSLALLPPVLTSVATALD